MQKAPLFFRKLQSPLQRRMRLLPKLILATAVCLGLNSATANTPPVAASNISEFQLENGLKVVVFEDHRAPLANLQVWYKVGAIDEYNGDTGLSHMLEHMMFEGTEKYPSGEFDKKLGERGMTYNASTDANFTTYYETMSSSLDELELAMDLESDRMQGLFLSEEGFQKENKVVQEERRLTTDDNPNSLLYESLLTTAFSNSPMRNPVIGWMTDIEHMKVEDLRTWYKRWYAPNNATLVIIGDVDPKKMQEMAQRYFGPLKPSTMLTPAKPQIEAPQKGARYVQLKAPAQTPILMLGYKTPVLSSVDSASAWEPFALKVLSGILAEGDSSRLISSLIKDKQILSMVAVEYESFARRPSLLTITVIPSPDMPIEKVKQELKAQIEQLQTTLVSKEELERAKAKLIAKKIYNNEAFSEQTSSLGLYTLLGLGPNYEDKNLANLLAVTPEQIQSVAKKYLVDDQSTLAELVPLPMSADTPTPKKASDFGHHKPSKTNEGE